MRRRPSSWQSARGAAASLTARYVGSQYEDDLNRQLIPDAFTLDAVAVLPLTAGLALEARAENLADARIVAGISGAGHRRAGDAADALDRPAGGEMAPVFQ